MRLRRRGQGKSRMRVNRFAIRNWNSEILTANVKCRAREAFRSLDTTPIFFAAASFSPGIFAEALKPRFSLNGDSQRFC
jgi:hypothetical protein